MNVYSGACPICCGDLGEAPRRGASVCLFCGNDADASPRSAGSRRSSGLTAGPRRQKDGLE